MKKATQGGSTAVFMIFFLLRMHTLYKTKKSTDKELDRLLISTVL